MRTLAREFGERAETSTDTLQAVATRAACDHNRMCCLRRLQTLNVDGAWLRRRLAVYELVICVGIQLGKLSQKRDHGPNLVVAMLRRPCRHAGKLEAVFDDYEELA